MILRKSRGRATVIATVGALALAVGASLMVRDEASSQAPGNSELKTVSWDLLDSAHVALSRPSVQQGRAAMASREGAEKIALARNPGARIRESALLNVQDRFAEPPVACLCWVVVIESGQPMYIHEPVPVEGKPAPKFMPQKTFRIELVDATTGTHLYGIEGAIGQTVSQ